MSASETKVKGERKAGTSSPSSLSEVPDWCFERLDPVLPKRLILSTDPEERDFFSSCSLGYGETLKV